MIRSVARSSLRTKFVRYNSTDRILNVSLDDPNPNVEGFFNYTWGRWLADDKRKKSERETRFSLKGLAEIVKDKIPALIDAPVNPEKQIKTIAPYHEGKHHKIYKVDLVDGRSFCLRIPYAIGPKQYRDARMKSEVATMDFLQKKHKMRIPSVYAYSSNRANPLESEYMITDFIKGDLLMKSWNPANTDIQAKSQTIKPIVDFMDSILTTQFNKFGSLYFTEHVPSNLQNDLPYDNEKDKQLIDRWRIGPTTESRFWKGSSTKLTKDLRGPWKSVNQYLEATAQVQLTYIEELLYNSGSVASAGPEIEQLQRAQTTFERYAKIAPQLFKDEDKLPSQLFSARLYHPDLNPMNVVMQNQQNPFLLDFECTAIRPFLLHGVPGFVKHNGPKIYNREQDVPDYDQLSVEEQRSIDHLMAQTQNQFAFEYLFKSSQHEDLFMAFLPNVKRRQQLVEAALAASATSYVDLDYDMYMLSHEWHFLVNNNREFAVEYLDEDVKVIAEENDVWNDYVMRNPFIETKGWLPTSMFDKYLKEGILVKSNDGYEYKPK